MFKELSSLPFEIDGTKVKIVVGLEMKEGMTEEEAKNLPILCAILKEENEKYVVYENDDSTIYKQIETTARVYTKGFVDGCRTSVLLLQNNNQVEEKKFEL